jgi:hypothetical protein
MIRLKLQDNIYMLPDLEHHDEIENEINDWKDMDKLQQKANQFKPKLIECKMKLFA